MRFSSLILPDGEKKTSFDDLGTGCGIIPMIMQRQAPPRHIWGVDIQSDAIAQFTQAVIECHVQNAVTPICADLKHLWTDAPFAAMRPRHLQSPL